MTKLGLLSWRVLLIRPRSAWLVELEAEAPVEPEEVVVASVPSQGVRAAVVGGLEEGGLVAFRPAW